MEVRFLANCDANLRFCLLTDFTDADQEQLPEDEALLIHISNNIKALNKKYPRPNGDHFLVMHRPRVWNAQEKTWMAYERKRGKLGALNAYLRGAGTKAFMPLEKTYWAEAFGMVIDKFGVKWMVNCDAPK